MTELESHLRATLEAVAHDPDLAGPDAEALLIRARTARTTRHRTVMAGIAAVLLLVPLVLVLTIRSDGGGSIPAARPSQSPSVATTPDGWTEFETHGLKLSMPPGTVLNPRFCPGGRPHLLTRSVSCRWPSATAVVPSSVVVWVSDGQPSQSPAGRKVLQTLDRDGLSGFVVAMLDPGWSPATADASYNWTLVENTTTTVIGISGNDPEAGQRVIDSLRLATR